MTDTGDLLAVPLDARLDVDDRHPDETAGDTPDLGAVYADPGPYVDGPLG